MANEVDVTHLPRTEDLIFWLVWLVPAIVLLFWDVLKAWKRRAPWVPGQALQLSAVIIQLLSFIDYSHISVYSGSRYQTEEVEAILVKNELVIDSGRLMMCVLIAYLLPGMARSGSITDGSNLAALALSIASHVFSELRSDWKVEKQNESFSALAASSDGLSVECSCFCIIIVFSIIIVFTYLLVLLIRAVMIGRTIRTIISQKIPPAISCCRPSTCDPIKKHALKCWIVVRLCQPDYVLSRSGFCSKVCPTVTICFGFYFIKWIFIDNELLNSVTKSRTLVQLVIAGQILIVVIGWIVLLVRGVTSDIQGIISSKYYVYGMSIEDALTDLIAYFIRLFVWDKRIQEKRIRDMNKKIRDIPSLWNPPHWVEKLFQIFSMQYQAHWLRIIKQKLAHPFQNAEVDDPQFSVYHDTLDGIIIPGESAMKLWKANRWGFRKVEERMRQGDEDGQCNPRKLICLLRTRTPEDEDDGVKEDLQEDLQRANTNSWKRTAVSLIYFMIHFYHDSGDVSIENAMQCYIDGWEYMDFVDGLIEEVKSLGRQADGEFDSLQDSWNKHRRTEIQMPLMEVADPKDSRVVADNCLLKTGRVIDRYLSNPKINKIDWLQRALANVYFFYLTKDLNKAVIQKCSKLAEEGIEEEILDVAFLAAKAQGLLDEVNRVQPPHNTDQASTSSTILQTWHTALRRWLRWLRLLNEEASTSSTIPTDQASTRSTIPTVNERVGEGNGLPDQGSISQNEIELASTSSTILQTWHTALRRWLRLLNEEDGQGNNRGRYNAERRSNNDQIDQV